ncbi:hypothetical protein DMC30DRAFT_400941 [Rhodotorula diobovata]|uniref:SH3 domain-containing protein n=1 Tax=Rhodotorula diobovata TaxID=5288 RepID=A0A5C5FR33_9BASI|nr:hypothetical protein DMC30DRAFT_400941 [Rhodotorula diobovata]
MATPRATEQSDVVWALHTFEAENDDELAFAAGERIIVLERDDQYGDGWFQVRPSSARPSFRARYLRGVRRSEPCVLPS